jgi:S1-C subfamily serine protease
LLDIDGKLIGINGSITTRHGVKINSGAGYAISIAQIKRFLPALKAGGVVAHGRIDGLNVVNTDKGNDGARISSVRGALASAGLREGDVITELAGLPIPNAMRFMGAVSTFPARDGARAEGAARPRDDHRQGEAEHGDAAKPGRRSTADTDPRNQPRRKHAGLRRGHSSHPRRRGIFRGEGGHEGR